MSVVPSRRIEVEKQCEKLQTALLDFKVSLWFLDSLTSNFYDKETLESGRHLYDTPTTELVNSFDKSSLLLPIKKQKVEPIKEEPPKLQAIVQKLRSILQRAG